MNEPGPVKTAEEWRAELSPEQYAVCRCSATEPPFSGKWYRHHAEGTYVCVACRSALFGSDSKYDSGSGWPSFWQPLVPVAVSSHDDDSHGMRRIEVRCAHCDSHLGPMARGPPDCATASIRWRWTSCRSEFSVLSLRFSLIAGSHGRRSLPAFSTASLRSSLIAKVKWAAILGRTLQSSKASTCAAALAASAARS